MERPLDEALTALAVEQLRCGCVWSLAVMAGLDPATSAAVLSMTSLSLGAVGKGFWQVSCRQFSMSNA